jgi:hypothetical protein
MYMLDRGKHAQALPASYVKRLNAVELKIEWLFALLKRLVAAFHQFGRSEVAMRRKRRLTVTEEIMRQVIKDGFKAMHFCKEVDERGGKIPATWTAKGCPNTFVKAYLVKRWRHRIHTEKWRIAKSMSS